MAQVLIVAEVRYLDACFPGGPENGCSLFCLYFAIVDG
jgi:membrane-associated PAP2 superfamily phosphatase